MLDVAGTGLTAEDREVLRHPLVGGVILFTRNYRDPAQLAALTAEIHALRAPPLLIAVDHEGGRVQRFRDGFTHLPSVTGLGVCHDRDRVRALHLAERSGWLMAAELRAAGVDLSFAPVLDLDRGESSVMRERCFHRQPRVVAELAQAYVRGMNAAGMAATAKHFPGHGGVPGDSHHDLPVDRRAYADIEAEDLRPFAHLIRNGLAAVMPAHVLYPDADGQHTAGFSPFWIGEVLRRRLGFQGAVFSDDLSMQGAAAGGGPLARAQAALAAGCDVALICNDRAAAVEILDGLPRQVHPASSLRLAHLHGGSAPDWSVLRVSEAWRTAVASLREYDPAPLLDMDLA
jgi:beta-N-acetylhexosaminidase